MVKLQRKSEVENQLPSKNKIHYTGGFYPEIFSHTKDSELKYRYAINGIKNRKFEPTPSAASCAFCPYKNDLCNLNQ